MLSAAGFLNLPLILYRSKNENGTQCFHQDQKQRQIGKVAIIKLTKLIRELSS
jgi:hypothetical protein